MKAGRNGPLPRFPFKINRKGNTVTILAPTEAKPCFRVQYRSKGKRNEKTFQTFLEAEKAAQGILKALCSGSHTPLEFKSTEVDNYRVAKTIADGRGHTIIEALSEWDAAVKNLPEGLSLVQAVELGKRYHISLRDIEIEKAVTQYLDKKKAEVNEKYFRSIKAQMERFSVFFRARQVSSLTKDDLLTFINSLEYSQKTINHHIGGIRQFLNWCITLDHLPKDSRLVEVLIKRRLPVHEEIHILTPDQLNKVLEISDLEIRARLALSAFAGLRTSEVLSFSTQDILENSLIAVSPQSSKTGKRRTIEICSRLRKYLENIDIRELLRNPWVAGERNFQKRVSSHYENVGIVRKHNLLRHSYISYRLALTGNINKVALESDNSPQIINQHYKALVSIETAHLWFGYN